MAGVKGGNTSNICNYLLSVVQEEVDQGRPPDVVVILTGSNDLKRIIKTDGEHGHHASIRGFRSNLMGLVQDICNISPKTCVIFPSLPTYRLNTNSILNLFPLNVFLDGLLGLWDSQKKHIAKECPGVMQVDLSPHMVAQWYKEMLESGVEEPTLIAADGIHPNARCYAKWGQYCGDAIANAVLNQQTAAVSSVKRSTQPKPALAFAFSE